MRPCTLDRIFHPYTKPLNSHVVVLDHTHCPNTRIFNQSLRPLRTSSTTAEFHPWDGDFPDSEESQKSDRPVRTFFCPRAGYSSLQKGGDPAAGSPTATLLRLRPSHRARLRPLAPVRVAARTSGAPNFHGVTGGVYKARERIHRGVADPRLLAIPASCSRVTDCNPNLDRLFPIRSASRHRNGLYRPL